MKKIIYIVACTALAAGLMVGCGANTTDTQSKQTTQSTPTDDGASKQKNFQKVDLEGEVASIDGNKITLKVIKTLEKGSQKDKSNDTAKTDSQENNKDKQVSNAAKNKKIEYTGENKDITISDGIKIKSMNRGKQASQSKDLNVSDIKVGDVLQITYSDKDSQTISNINVRQATNQNEQTSNN